MDVFIDGFTNKRYRQANNWLRRRIINIGILVAVLRELGPTALRLLGSSLKGDKKRAVEGVASAIEGARSRGESQSRAIREATHKLKMAELECLESIATKKLHADIKKRSIDASEKQSARKMMSYNDGVFAMQKQMSCALIIIGILLYFSSGYLWATGETSAAMVPSNIATGFISQVIGFWLGSSSGSKAKDLQIGINKNSKSGSKSDLDDLEERLPQLDVGFKED